MSQQIKKQKKYISGEAASHPAIQTKLYNFKS